MRIVVMGCSGLIGAEVCRVAAEAGHRVTGLSRRGRPRRRGDWADGVEWIAANVFDQAALASALDGADAVVHAIGIVRERRGDGITFERMNCEAAVQVGRAAARAGVRRIVFLSAARTPPLVSDRYLRAKRRAEIELAALGPRATALRPFFVYGRRRAVTLPPALALGIATRAPVARRFLGDLRPLSAVTVARAAVRVAEAGGPPVLDAAGIEEMAGR